MADGEVKLRSRFRKVNGTIMAAWRLGFPPERRERHERRPDPSYRPDSPAGTCHLPERMSS
jgi:hypothetical protein